MPATRELCTTAGEYVSQCACAMRLDMTVGMFFPRCHRCDQPVVWELKQADPPQT